MAKKLQFKQLGITNNNVKVVTGAFQYFETRGIPLDIIITILNNHNMIIDWIDFYKSSINIWPMKTTLAKIYSALLLTNDERYAKIIISKLQNYIQNENTNSSTYIF